MEKKGVRWVKRETSVTRGARLVIMEVYEVRTRV